MNLRWASTLLFYKHSKIVTQYVISQAKQTWKDIANESTGSESEGDDDKEDRVSMERKLSAISKNIFGYTEVQTISTSESDEGKESVKDSSPIEKPVVESSQVVENPVEPMEEEEKEESSKPQLPPYLPALMGCRSVENYKWLNRIEEGTYGVVFRGEDKKTGTCITCTCVLIYALYMCIISDTNMAKIRSLKFKLSHYLLSVHFNQCE